MTPNHPRWPLVAALALAVAYLVGGICLPGSTTAVFDGDIGMKFVQIDNLVHGHAWLEYPGRAVDPEFRLHPYRHPFVFQEGRHVYSVYLNTVNYLAAPIYYLSGVQGCRVLTMVCVLGLMAGTYLLTNRMDHRRSGASAATLLLVATPLWLYGWVFWEHAPAALLCLAATLILTRATARQGTLAVIAAGIVLGIAASCRPEALIYLGASAIALGVGRRDLKAPVVLVVAALAVILPLAFATPGLGLRGHYTQNFTTAGLTAANPMTLIRSRLVLAAGLVGGVLRPPPFGVSPLWFMATTFALLSVMTLAALRRSSNAIPQTLCFLAVGLLAWAQSAPAFVDERTLMTGLLTSCPVAVLALAAGVVTLRRPASPSEGMASPIPGLVAMTAIGFTAGVLLLTPNDAGPQWGPRYLLPVFPLLVSLLCSTDETVDAKVRRSRRLQRAVAGVLIAASVITQTVGAANHIRIQREKAISLSRMVSLPGRHVLTTKWYVPQEAALAILRTDKAVLYAPLEQDLAYGVEQLDRAGVQAFTFVGAGVPGRAPLEWGRFREALASRFFLNPFDLYVFEFARRDSSADGNVTPSPEPRRAVRKTGSRPIKPLL